MMVSGLALLIFSKCRRISGPPGCFSRMLGCRGEGVIGDELLCSKAEASKPVSWKHLHLHPPSEVCCTLHSRVGTDGGS